MFNYSIVIIIAILNILSISITAETITQHDLTSTYLGPNTISTEKLDKVSAIVNFNAVDIEDLDNKLFHSHELLRMFSLTGSPGYKFPENKSFLDHKHLDVVEIVDTGIDQIYEETFSELPALRKMTLSDNYIKYLPDNIFRGNSRLSSLNVDFNDITEINRKVFASLSYFTTLTMDGNFNFNFRQSEVFIESESLTRLSCKYCGITTISSETFSMIPNLKSLDLEHNQIDHISDDAFQFQTQLTHLNLADNKFKSFTFQFIPQFFVPNINDVATINLDENVMINLKWSEYQKNMEKHATLLNGNSFDTPIIIVEPRDPEELNTWKLTPINVTPEMYYNSLVYALIFVVVLIAMFCSIKFILFLRKGTFTVQKNNKYSMLDV